MTKYALITEKFTQKKLDKKQMENKLNWGKVFLTFLCILVQEI